MNRRNLCICVLFSTGFVYLCTILYGGLGETTGSFFTWLQEKPDPDQNSNYRLNPDAFWLVNLIIGEQERMLNRIGVKNLTSSVGETAVNCSQDSGLQDNWKRAVNELKERADSLLELQLRCGNQLRSKWLLDLHSTGTQRNQLSRSKFVQFEKSIHVSNNFYEVLRFSVTMESEELQPLTLKVTSILKSMAQYVAKCEDISSPCLSVSLTVDDAIDCGKRSEACLAISPQLIISLKLSKHSASEQQIYVIPLMTYSWMKSSHIIQIPPFEFLDYLTGLSGGKLFPIDHVRPILLATALRRSSEIKEPFNLFVPNLLNGNGKNLIQLLSDEDLVACEEENDSNPMQKLVQLFAGTNVWMPCATHVQLLSKSKFGLIIGNIATTTSLDVGSFANLIWQLQILLCLRMGAVPVLLGNNLMPFPAGISDAQWKLATVQIPLHLSGNLISLLQSYSPSELKDLAYHGRRLYERHFKDYHALLSTVLLEVNKLYGFPQPLAPEYFTVQTGTFYPKIPYHEISEEKKIPVQVTKQMRSITKVDKWQANPFWSYNSLPWDRKYFDTHKKLHSNKKTNFQTMENFTIVMLFYDRFPVLLSTLKTLENVTSLAKVLLLWNNPVPPDKYLRWPSFKFPLEIIKMKKNSLSNRYIPWNMIETDAILSIDDDIQLKKEEIELGFRVWRQNPQRLVGYVARSVGYETTTQKWTYQVAITDHYSMILTGAAFFHKYYTYAYTWDMPQEIRTLVDQLQDCDDLSMNFLVAHLTRESPIKVGTRLNFPCDGCKNALSWRKQHYIQRAGCIEKLVNIYGYNPLLSTPYVATYIPDS